MDYCIYSDESDLIGKKFSNFYGGGIVRSDYVHVIENALNAKCVEHNINSEIKWKHLSSNYLKQYIDFIDCFFNFLQLEDSPIKVRVMFTDNRFKPENLSEEQIRNGYHILYYHFLKNAFGLKHCQKRNAPRNLHFRIDNRPSKKEQRWSFVDHIINICNMQEFKHLQLNIDRKNISFVESHRHRICQALDVIVGAMSFRLNEKHLERPEGAKKRGKTTIAKEKLYRHIKNRIWLLKANFNIGVSTGYSKPEDLWLDPYRHWIFKPKEHLGIKKTPRDLHM